MIDKNKNGKFSLEAKIVHGYDGGDPLTGAVSFPIYQTSTYLNPKLGFRHKIFVHTLLKPYQKRA